MRDEHDRHGPSTEDLPPLRRPPYGLPLQRRVRPIDAATADLHWRRYATPTPPKTSALTGSDRRTRLVLTAGFLACVVLGVWSSGWSTEDSYEGSRRVEPVHHLSTAEKPFALTSPSPELKDAALASTTPSPEPTVVKSTKREQVSASGVNRHRKHRVVRIEPRRKPSAPAARDRATGGKRAHRDNTGTPLSLIAARCDELFPPSRPAFRMRNQLCHQIYGR